MPQTSDDLDAVRAIAKALEPFKAEEQERIIRWVREKIGLSAGSTIQEPPPPGNLHGQVVSSATIANIKDFLNMKQPKSDNQLAAAVAYYYRFVAPENERKQSITREDLLNACRLADWERPNHAAQVLINSQGAGLLDRGPEKGSYVINSVGENLVAVALPSTVKSTSPRKSTKRGKR